MVNARLYLLLARQAWREAFLVPQKLLAALFVLCLRTGLLLAIYRMAYQFSPRPPQEVSFASAIWSIGVYFILLSIMIRHIYVDISKDVRQGTIELKLGKPYSYTLSIIATRIGRGLPDAGISLIAAVAILWTVAGVPPIDFSFLWVLQIVCLIIGGVICASLLYTLVGLTAFWLEDAEPVYWISDKFVMLLGGAYVPVVLFPGWLKSVATWLPFGSFTFAAQAFHPSFTTTWPSLFVSQLLWMVVLGVGVRQVFQAARRRVSINGG